MAQFEGPPLEPRSFFESRAAAPLSRESVSSYTQSGTFTLETRDDDDHTFHGIIFDIELAGRVPIEYVDVEGVGVRGALGRTRVLGVLGGFARSAPGGQRSVFLQPPSQWTVLFDAHAAPARGHALRDLPFSKPMRLSAGTSTKLGVYVHAESLDGVVYNNQRHRGVTLEDAHVRILSGVAHTGGALFAPVGYWGDSAWRPLREFVGCVRYSVRVKLWTPQSDAQFEPKFRKMVRAMLLCRASSIRHHAKTALGALPIEALYFVLSYCSHAWPPEPPAEAPAVEADADPANWEVRRDAYGSRVLVKRSATDDGGAAHPDDDEEWDTTDDDSMPDSTGDGTDDELEGDQFDHLDGQAIVIDEELEDDEDEDEDDEYQADYGDDGLDDLEEDDEAAPTAAPTPA
ncbi:hypothetical protein M885DRAFT_530142 [Pelagophyceae sp. CCMP2097]|nr:hypothetical protein M885DRAFT_530142 [Pelagophyceae sp. CCMP2097]